MKLELLHRFPNYDFTILSLSIILCIWGISTGEEFADIVKDVLLVNPSILIFAWWDRQNHLRLQHIVAKSISIWYSKYSSPYEYEPSAGILLWGLIYYYLYPPIWVRVVHTCDIVSESECMYPPIEKEEIGVWRQSMHCNGQENHYWLGIDCVVFYFFELWCFVFPV